MAGSWARSWTPHARLVLRISSRRWAAPLVVFGLILASPCLFNGLQADDYVIRAAILGSHPWDLQGEGLQDAYRFLDGDPENWLGGENVRPKPKDNEDDDDAPTPWQISLGLFWEQILSLLFHRGP